MSDSRTQSNESGTQVENQPRAFPPRREGPTQPDQTAAEHERVAPAGATATQTTGPGTAEAGQTTTQPNQARYSRRRLDTEETDRDEVAAEESHAHERRVVHEEHLAHERQAEEVRRERFGGYNTGADFFGWLVAIALSVLLASVVGAVVTAVSINLQVDQTEAERRAGTVGLATAIALLVILMIGYYAGGYVAGRMSRYDGGRQGFGVWIIGLLVTIAAVVVGAVFGSQYNILDRVDLPSIPIPRDTLTSGGIVAAAAILVGTLLAALLGGKVGQRYHRRVDRTGL